jgi:hypothetical protein
MSRRPCFSITAAVSGVVDEDVEAPVLLDHCRHGPNGIRLATNVTRDTLDANLLGGIAQDVFAPACDRHHAPFSLERLGNAPAYSFTSTCDQRDGGFEFHGFSQSSGLWFSELLSLRQSRSSPSLHQHHPLRRHPGDTAHTR